MKNTECLDVKMTHLLISNICKENGYDYHKFADRLKDAIVGWHSRSIATALFAFGYDCDGSLCVLASQRGEGAADYKGLWNCPCGYLDYDETIKDCAIRETYEETGVNLKDIDISLYTIEDSVASNHQNVTFIYYALLQNCSVNDFRLSPENNEPQETQAIKWIKVDDIDAYNWAFGHNNYIKEIHKKI